MLNRPNLATLPPIERAVWRALDSRNAVVVEFGSGYKSRGHVRDVSWGGFDFQPLGDRPTVSYLFSQLVGVTR